MFELRNAIHEDIDQVLAFTRALNAEEQIEIDEAALRAAIHRLIDEPGLGAIFLVEEAGVTIGHAVVTYGYDLEFAGRDAYLTEIWIDPPARRRGAGTAALDRIAYELRAADFRAFHLQVRPDNPAIRLYERAGFVASRRIIMTRVFAAP